MDIWGSILKNALTFLSAGLLAIQSSLSPAPVKLPAPPPVAAVRERPPPTSAPPRAYSATTTVQAATSSAMHKVSSKPPAISRQPFSGLAAPRAQGLTIVFPAVTSSAILPAASASSSSSSSIVLNAVSPPVSSGAMPAAPQPTNLDPQSIVGLSCDFKNRNDGTLLSVDKGSGVLIDPRGYLVTSRHLVDLDFAAGIDSSFKPYANLYNFDHCEVGQISKGTALPTPGLISTVNPIIRVPVLGYAAHLIYTPNNAQVSSLESQELDFAVLKIDGTTADGKTFGVTLPASFPAAKLLADAAALKDGDEVVSYGYPGDVSAGLHSGFTTLYLVGSVGAVAQILGGDRYFLNKPFVINTKMSVSGGRSGSPLIWRGYVAGIVSAYEEGNSADSYSVAAPAILEFLPADLRR